MPVIPRMGGSAGGCGVHRREVSRESGSLKTSKPRSERDSAPRHGATDRGHAANGILIGLRGYTIAVVFFEILCIAAQYGVGRCPSLHRRHHEVSVI
jgi:hypothetical protein